MSQEIRIPDIGDIDQVEVIEICVAIGDSVGENDALIVIESDKASMEVPAGFAGTVASIDVSLADQVTEGTLIATLQMAEASDAAEPAGSAEVAAAEISDGSPDETLAETPVGKGAELAATQPEADQSDTKAIESTPAASSESTTIEIRVPDIGEATNVVVIEVAVQAGAVVAEDDLLVVVESDKASMEIPAGHAGTVEQVAVEVGAEVIEGTLLATIRAESTAPSAQSVAVAKDEISADSVSTEAEPEQVEAAASSARIYAGPAVRRLARELGVQLLAVAGTGNRGRILKDDVKSFVKATLNRPSAAGAAAASGGIPALPAVDFSKFGPIEEQALSRIRVAGAANLHRSWLNLPHVTQFEEADVTELETFRRTLKEEAARRQVKITPLAFIVKACCYALQAYPTFNASLDPALKNFVLKKYYHIGFAVDTLEGLVVPVIKDADRMGVWELSEAIAELAEAARTQSLGLGDMQGGSFSISSLGNIGGTGFTPIINAPEVAILGVSRLVTKPVWNGTDFEPRQILPLSLSYDHRAINGAEAGRFMATLAELLGDIRRLAL